MMKKIVKPKGINPHRSFAFIDGKKPRLPRKVKKWYKNLFAQTMGFNPKELQWQFKNFANYTFEIQET